jgi:hypothetical protein
MRHKLAGVFAAALLLSASAALAQDLSVIAITQPVSGCALAATENVTIRIFNFGNILIAGTSFSVSYTINAGGPVNELATLGSNLLTNSTLNYTFTTRANLSIPGTYTFNATVSLPGDVNPTNNAFTGYVVTNTAPSAGGAVSGGTNVCVTGNSGVLTLSGHTGGVVRWEFSTDGGSTWNVVSNTTTTQPYNNLTVPTLYRALVQNGTCTAAYSSVASMTIDPASVGGTVSGSATVCPGSNAGTLTLTGRTGNVVRWEKSIDGGLTWTNIANTTASLSYVNVVLTTKYRALVQSGSCASQFSSVATLTTGTPSAAITAPADACPGSTGNTASVPDAGPGALYAWGIANGTITSGAASRTVAFTAAGPNDVALTASVQSPAGCVGNGNATVPLRTPAATLVAPASACVGATGLSAAVDPDQGPGAIYFWTIANGVITSGLGTRSITYDPTGAQPVTLEALVAQAGCLQDTLATVPLVVCRNPGAFHTLAPCRIVDTRGTGGPLGGPALAPGEARILPLSLSSCALPANAAAAALNVTTIASSNGALALGPGDLPAPATEIFPLVAGKTRAVHSLVRLATDGSGRIVAFNDSAGPVHVILDVTGTFE